MNVVSEGASDPGRTGSHGKAKIYVNGVQHSPVVTPAHSLFPPIVKFTQNTLRERVKDIFN